ncbi:putative disease resistance protein At3g14460 [Rhododendron vialii]|uniref:putative disease resistance protein At3g14460 n=1 Tax=Rhododendron vialii TaxID=182163 RepID=UPI00265F0200|nr:putative disease resistance protein At3g14460 [Rhododendron vialii]
MKALPEQMHTLLPSLLYLMLWKCPEIESFPEGGLPSKLDHLNINDCKKLVGGRRDWGLQTLNSFKILWLFGESEDELESFPEEGLLPSTLKHLRLERMSTLKSLNKRGLQHLGSLETIYISSCPQLQSLPEEGLPTSLVQLSITDCPLLKPRCRREEGEDWHKIARIPLIEIDGEVIGE